MGGGVVYLCLLYFLEKVILLENGPKFIWPLLSDMEKLFGQLLFNSTLLRYGAKLIESITEHIL